ncbi:MAG TPA: HAMP domain-containing sensor histidine kinase [Xanthobacteraceae bacterium]|nr:HAMP domain-containing sensor histidine kinase [Xanthobacteraceae bacterium]
MLLVKTLRSSTFRLALLSIAVFGAVVIGSFGYVYWSTASFVLSRSDRAIEAERASLRQAYDSGGRDGLIEAIAQRIADARSDGGVYLLADPAYGPVAGNLKVWPSELKGAAGWSKFSTDALPASPAVDRSLLRASFETLPDGFHLLVGKDIGDLGRFVNGIYAVLAFTILFVFVLAAVASVSVTRRTVGRIESINATSRAIMDSGLGRRIPLRGTQDEWDQLAHNLNSMLERIEALMAEVKQVTDNVAHDLRTPLTRMRGRLEKASLGRRDADADQSLIGATMADLDDVLRMFSSLTRISQIEGTKRTAAFRTVNLAEIASEVVELFDAAAEDKGGRIEVVDDRPVLISADRDLLFDAVANLVDNAIKHGREAGQVTVAVEGNDAEAVITVADDGPGIPADEHQHVFRRFYRLERSRCTPGNGLGLSLVAAVARLHGARIDMLDNAPGLRIELHFPSAGERGANVHGGAIATDGRRQ